MRQQNARFNNKFISRNFEHIQAFLLFKYHYFFIILPALK